jgi:hypothetical protein
LKKQIWKERKREINTKQGKKLNKKRRKKEETEQKKEK